MVERVVVELRCGVNTGGASHVVGVKVLA